MVRYLHRRIARPKAQGGSWSSAEASGSSGRAAFRGTETTQTGHFSPPPQPQSSLRKSRSEFRSKNEIFLVKISVKFYIRGSLTSFSILCFLSQHSLKRVLYVFTYKLLLHAFRSHRTAINMFLSGIIRLGIHRTPSPHHGAGRAQGLLGDPRTGPVPCSTRTIFIVYHLISGYASARLPYPMPLREAKHHCNS